MTVVLHAGVRQQGVAWSPGVKHHLISSDGMAWNLIFTQKISLQSKLNWNIFAKSKLWWIRAGINPPVQLQLVWDMWVLGVIQLSCYLTKQIANNLVFHKLLALFAFAENFHWTGCRCLLISKGVQSQVALYLLTDSWLADALLASPLSVLK